MKTFYTIVVSGYLIIASTQITNAQDGILDPTFGTAGIVTTDLGTPSDKGASVAVQSDGKIVMSGHVYNASNDFALVRYNTDGTLDSTFGVGGEVTTDFGGRQDFSNSVAIQSNGKIVAGGYSSSLSKTDFALARYNSDGTLDTTFGTGGKTIISVGSSYDNANAIAIQQDGKIIAVGATEVVFDFKFALVRVNSNGSLDNTFGSGGKITTVIGSGSDYISSVALQSNGKIVVGGCSNYNTSYNCFALARYNTNGSLDNTFGSAGKVTTTIGNQDDEINSVAIQDNGKIIAAGLSYSAVTNHDFALTRYNSNGTLDNTFGTGGKVTTDFGNSFDFGKSAVIQSDGKIIVAGVSSLLSTSPNDFAIARYNSDGSLDTTFGTNGKTITDFGGSDDWCYSVAIQSNGKIVTAGYTSIASDQNFAIARYNNPSLDVAAIGGQQTAISVSPLPFIDKLSIRVMTAPIHYPYFHSFYNRICII